MSVLMTLWVQGDPNKLEEWAASNQAQMREIAEQAKSHGCIAHRFYGSDDGQILVVDEWPDEQSFQTFFSGARDRIQPMMDAAGVTSEPRTAFWRTLETHDKVGWGA
jgi:quinol monooxygenase YgiN